MQQYDIGGATPWGQQSLDIQVSFHKHMSVHLEVSVVWDFSSCGDLILISASQLSANDTLYIDPCSNRDIMIDLMYQ